MSVMEDKLKKAGWKKSLEGWLDPIKGDKVSRSAAWNRYLKRLDTVSTSESK